MTWKKARAVYARIVITLSIVLSMTVGLAALYEANEGVAVELVDALTIFEYGSFGLDIISLLFTFLFVWTMLPAIDIVYIESRDLYREYKK